MENKKSNPFGSVNIAYAVYQLTRDESNRMYRFMGLEYLQSQNQQVEPERYHKIYEGAVPEKISQNANTVEDILERLYQRLNIGEKPDGYAGWSLSVSDVVVLSIDGHQTAHFVDSYGFREQPQFVKHNPLAAAEMSMEGNYNMIDGIINNLPQEQPGAQVPQQGQQRKNLGMER